MVLLKFATNLVYNVIKNICSRYDQGETVEAQRQILGFTQMFWLKLLIYLTRWLNI